MKQIKVVLLDDEISSIKSLKYELSKFPEIKLVKEFVDPHKFLETDLDYHAVFLDLDMPAFAINGKDIAMQIKKPIVFVTAHNAKYADEISEMVDLGDNYVALIPKSYKPERIATAIKKLHLRLNVLQNYVEWHNSTDNKSIEIKLIQVITTKDYSSENMPNAGRDKFLYRDGKKQMDVLNRNLDECMHDLPKEIFFKINDSHIVNKRFINEPKDKEVMVNLTVVEKSRVVVKPVSIKISPLSAEEFKAFYYT